jgi:hypothetical protein
MHEGGSDGLRCLGIAVKGNTNYVECCLLASLGREVCGSDIPALRYQLAEVMLQCEVRSSMPVRIMSASAR